MKNIVSNVSLQTGLMFTLIEREIQGRYRGSLLGIVWSMLTPLFMLGVYTFVFGVLMQSRWATGEGSQSTMGQYAVILFIGLMVFQMFSEVINRSASIVSANTNLVKKTIFPLNILVPVGLGAALFHFLVSLLILAVFVWFEFGRIPITVLYVPLVLLPFCMLVLGLGWFIASLGVFIRDIGQILGTVTTALMFLSPVFYPLSRLDDWMRSLIYLNPITLPMQQLRQVIIWGETPDVFSFLVYSAVALVIFISGLWWFNKTRDGFADVL